MKGLWMRMGIMAGIAALAVLTGPHRACCAEEARSAAGAGTDLLGSAGDWEVSGNRQVGKTVPGITDASNFAGTEGKCVKVELCNNGDGKEDYPAITRWFGSKAATAGDGIDLRKYSRIVARVYVVSDSEAVTKRNMVLVLMNRPKPGEKVRQQCCPDSRTPVGEWKEYEWDISKFDRDAVYVIVPHFYEGAGNDLNAKEKYTWYLAELKLVK